MTGIDNHVAALAAAQTAEGEQKRKEKESVVSNLGDGLDALDLGWHACETVAKAIRPTHTTGGKDALSGFRTGGGDGGADVFHTAADCTPDAAATAAESGGLIADAASAAGDIVSGAASVAGDVIGGLIGGIFEGL